METPSKPRQLDVHPVRSAGSRPPPSEFDLPSTSRDRPQSRRAGLVVAIASVALAVMTLNGCSTPEPTRDDSYNKAKWDRLQEAQEILEPRGFTVVDQSPACWEGQETTSFDPTSMSVESKRAQPADLRSLLDEIDQSLQQAGWAKSEFEDPPGTWSDGDPLVLSTQSDPELNVSIEATFPREDATAY